MLNWDPLDWDKEIDATPGFAQLRDLLTDGATLPGMACVEQARQAYASANIAAFTTDEQRVLQEIMGDVNANARLFAELEAPAAREARTPINVWGRQITYS